MIIMTEEYEGQVDYVGENTVVVVYNVNGNLIEQTYAKEQFINNKLPEYGTCVRVSVTVTEFEPKIPEYNPRTITHRKPLNGPDQL